MLMKGIGNWGIWELGNVCSDARNGDFVDAALMTATLEVGVEEYVDYLKGK